MSYELKISPKDRAVARFINGVRKALTLAAIDAKKRHKISQHSIAQKLGVNRSVINRQLRGEGNITLRSAAEIAWALGKVPTFSLEDQDTLPQRNIFDPIKTGTDPIKSDHIVSAPL
jgi:transcriptional regulator with XRE-family HTH domain